MDAIATIVWLTRIEKAAIVTTETTVTTETIETIETIVE